MPPAATAAASRGRLDAALVVILAGVVAALHVGKLPPAVPALREALGLSLVQAGFLLSFVQIAGMSAGIAFGALADGFGPRRSMLLGLALLVACSAAGGFADRVAALMVLRALEGFGFLLVVLAAPALVRRLVPPQRVSLMLGLWGAYMPLATALALLVGPLVIGAGGWRSWWWMLAGVTLAMALGLAAAVRPQPAAGDASAAAPAPQSAAVPWMRRLALTLAAPGPWLAAVAFALYSGQWLAVIGFLPTIYQQAGLGGALTGVLTALAAAVNMLGNIGAGRLLHGGTRPVHLLALGYLAMALAAAAAYAGDTTGAPLLPGPARYLAVLAFSGLGGVIPATLFTLALRTAPSEAAVSTTVGWVQQWSALGQFVGPPLAAWVAAQTGGWHWTWVVTGSASLLGLALTWAIARLQTSSS